MFKSFITTMLFSFMICLSVVYLTVSVYIFHICCQIVNLCFHRSQNSAEVAGLIVKVATTV